MYICRNNLIYYISRVFTIFFFLLHLVDASNPDYVCSPHSTIIASVIIVVVLNIITITAFVVFYRHKRKEWRKRSAVSEVSHRGVLRPISSGNTSRVHPVPVSAANAPPPPLPSRPSTSSGALGLSPPIYNSSNSEVNI